jgi:3-hydroxybutyrate dehydrogenase
VFAVELDVNAIESRAGVVEKQIAARSQAHRMSAERILTDVTLAAQPVKRLIEPEEVADVTAFLIGPSRRSFTRVAVSMNQGRTAR